MNQADFIYRLLAAVVATAIKDACGTNRFEASSAINFLFNHSEGYLSLLEIDAGSFRKRLMKIMFTRGGDAQFTETEKFHFRENLNSVGNLQSLASKG